MVKGQTFFEMRVFGEAGAAEFRVTVWPRGLRWRPQKQGPLAGGGGGKCPRQGGTQESKELTLWFLSWHIPASTQKRESPPTRLWS